MAKKVQTFRVEGFVKAWVQVEVRANSLEDALETARTLRPSDFVKYDGECLDHSLKIISVNDTCPEVNA